MAVNAVPRGYRTVTPYLVVKGVFRLLDFIKDVFGAVETERITRPDGTIAHAEVRIGDSMVMMGEAPENAAMPTMLYVYLPDVDAIYKRALQAGATPVREPLDEIHGDRAAAVQDPSGNQWWIATHVKDVSSEEVQQRYSAQLEKRG